MGTMALFAVVNSKTGKIHCSRCRYDGYDWHCENILANFYDTEAKALKLASRGFDTLCPSIEETQYSREDEDFSGWDEIFDTEEQMEEGYFGNLYLFKDGKWISKYLSSKEEYRKSEIVKKKPYNNDYFLITKENSKYGFKVYFDGKLYFEIDEVSKDKKKVIEQAIEFMSIFPKFIGLCDKLKLEVSFTGKN